MGLGNVKVEAMRAGQLNRSIGHANVELFAVRMRQENVLLIEFEIGAIGPVRWGRWCHGVGCRLGICCVGGCIIGICCFGFWCR